MLKKIAGLFIVINLGFSSFNGAKSQESISDSSILMPSLRLGYSSGFPQRDLKERMGFTSILNTKFEVKFRNQWIIGTHYNFMFGGTIKDSGMLTELLSDGGGIINSNGEFGTYEMLQRGHHGGFYVGRLFPVFSPNPNSGIIATLGAGIFTHRLIFNNFSGDIVQLNVEFQR